MNFGRNQTLDPLHSPRDLGNYNHTEKHFLKDALQLSEPKAMFCDLVCSVWIADLQTTTSQGSGAPWLRLLSPSYLGHHHLVGAATAHVRSRTKDNLPVPPGVQPLRGFHPPGGCLSPHRSLPCFWSTYAQGHQNVVSLCIWAQCLLRTDKS